MKNNFNDEINNFNYMKFVNRGEDNKVIEFFCNLRSSRVARQDLTKIAKHLLQIGQEERSTKYLDEAGGIGLRDIREIAAKYAEQNQDEMAIILCKQAYNNVDKIYLLETMVDHYISYDTIDEDELYTIYTRSNKYLKEAFNLDPSDTIIFKKLMINLEGLAQHEEVIKLSMKAQINDIEKADILDEVINLENYSTEILQKYMLELLRLNPQTYNADNDIIYQLAYNFVELAQPDKALEICNRADIPDAEKLGVLGDIGMVIDNNHLTNIW